MKLGIGFSVTLPQNPLVGEAEGQVLENTTEVPLQNTDEQNLENTGP